MKTLFEEIMNKYFLNLVKKKHSQVWEVHRVLNKMNAKRTISRHIIIKIAKVKDIKKY